MLYKILTIKALILNIIINYAKRNLYFLIKRILKYKTGLRRSKIQPKFILKNDQMYFQNSNRFKLIQSRAGLGTPISNEQLAVNLQAETVQTRSSYKKINKI